MNKLRRYALQGSQSALEKLILIGQMVNSTAEAIEVLDNWGMLMEDISEEEREALGMGQSDGGTGPAAPVRPEAAEAPPEPPKSLSQHWFTEVPERDEA
jgi:hypothetical protein